jgi:ATP-dependent DNA helicase RecG
VAQTNWLAMSAVAGARPMSSLTHNTPVRFLKGIGERRAEALARLGVMTAGDLLYHIPRRYLDATLVTPLGKVTVGKEVTCVGHVVTTGVLPTRKGLRVFRAVLKDQTGHVECAWPGQPFLERTIKKGQFLLVTGPVRHYHGRQIVPREFIILEEEDSREPGAGSREGAILPIYPATENLSHRQIRRLVHQHLPNLVTLAHDRLPVGLRAKAEVQGLPDALRAVHQPASVEEADRGRRRLALDELFEQQILHSRARYLAKRARRGIAFELTKTYTTKLKEALPFELTHGQKEAIREIVADMAKPDRMYRLLMGDVGTGKTVVALFAMLLAVENDRQGVLMAPTELLAEQHAATLTALLGPLQLKPELLVGRLSAADKAASRERIKSGAARLIVGTHALIQEQVQYHRLGLAVIDEQHRFGVEQRAALVGKGEVPDVLLLTATPIPRTLALAFYGDLDISELREKPAGRGEIKTGLRRETSRRKIYEFVKKECSAGRQAYVVYPVIVQSEKADLKAATTMYEKLKVEFRPLKVGLVHGRVPAEERDETMRAFRDNKVQVLVATTVIEVGIDVPNATVMLIEHADRFGLAQLHQLRGRIGRGEGASTCILMTDSAEAQKRLKAFAETTDGFKIAELDLHERGMGELAGTRQAGGITLRFADLSRDLDLLEMARGAAQEIIERDPGLIRAEHGELRARLLERYQRAMELFRVG